MSLEMCALTIYVLFGSQTGNAEAIAKELTYTIKDKVYTRHSDCSCLGEKAHIVCSSLLNVTNHLDALKHADLVCIVCSTTGNGEPPENASKFWRTIKKRTMAKDTFQDMPVAVLALGDSNYDQFCYMGKSIHKRVLELGARSVLELTCIDEVDGLEDAVEDWLGRIESLIL